MVTGDPSSLFVSPKKKKKRKKEKTPDSKVNEMVDLGFNFYQSANFSRNFTTCGFFPS